MKENGQKRRFESTCKDLHIVVEKIAGPVGTSDLWGCCNGKFFAIELKDYARVKKLAPTEIQRHRIVEYLKAGGTALVASISAKECIVRRYISINWEGVRPEPEGEDSRFLTYRQFVGWFLELFREA